MGGKRIYPNMSIWTMEGSRFSPTVTDPTQQRKELELHSNVTNRGVKVVKNIKAQKSLLAVATAPGGARSAVQAHKIICHFWKAASSLVSSPRSPFVSARKCLEWGMKILACPCSSERVFLQLQHVLGSSEQGVQVRFPPLIAILTKKIIIIKNFFFKKHKHPHHISRWKLLWHEGYEAIFRKQHHPPVFNF